MQRSIFAQTAAVGADLDDNGLRRTLYISVAAPRNASLLALVESRRSADVADEFAEVTISTLIRGVAPTRLVAHGGRIYFTVATAHTVRAYRPTY